MRHGGYECMACHNWYDHQENEGVEYRGGVLCRTCKSKHHVRLDGEVQSKETKSQLTT